jgi:UDP-glucose 4-epimerase
MKNSNILVIGGAGYIGSHLIRVLGKSKYTPIIFDNLSTGHKKFIPKQMKFVKGDLRNYASINKVLSANKINVVIHLSASSLVAESVIDPLKYYDNNVLSFINLLKAMRSQKINKLIFSSTGAVYGEPQHVPIDENDPKNPINPYGKSKLMMEQIIEDTANAHKDISYIILRYFNVAGAFENAAIGEMHDPETHIIPNILKSLTNKSKQLNIFGKNFPTKDGTCIRDYIHVQDICEAHLLSIEALKKGIINQAFNLGTQTGASILDLLNMVTEVTGQKISYKISRRRLGDPAKLIANSKKAHKFLGWTPKQNLYKIIHSAWEWEKRNWLI